MKTRISIVLFNLILTGCSGTTPNLGINNGKLLSCPPSPNCVSSQATDNEHFIEPLHYQGTQQAAQQHLLQILKSEARTKIVTEEEHYLRAEFTSALLGFVDDVEFYFPEQAAGEKIIHVRSASRIGYSDLGVNRERLERIRAKFSD